MFTLSEALEYIANWVPQKSSTGKVLYPILNPGLTAEEIQQKAKNLPFELPQEVYELYQWSDGGSLECLPYPGRNYKGDYEKIYDFLPLEDAVNLALSWKNGCFPLFKRENTICFTVGSKDKQNTAPIFSTTGSPLADKPRFESLTTLILKLVEAMQYQLNQNK